MNFRSNSWSSALIALCAFLVSAGCASKDTITSAPEAGQQAALSIPEVSQDYINRIERYSAGETEYAGFYNNFAYKATLLNFPIRTLLVERQAEYYQWDRDRAEMEREKANQEMSSETQVFMSFYTPDRRNDNLTDSKSIWRVYLEAGGRRYEGKVKKIRSLLAELQALYPYHSRWNTPYMVAFPVPTTAIEGQTVTFTVTGPLGTRAVEFKAAP